MALHNLESVHAGCPFTRFRFGIETRESRRYPLKRRTTTATPVSGNNLNFLRPFHNG